MEKFHVADVVKVDLVLKYHHQSFSIQSHSQDSRGKREFAYRRLPLL